MIEESQIQLAAQAIASADALLIGAGAGMGVDSGLPDFRGNVGFWVTYPAYAQLGLDFAALANPHWFDNDPDLAWGFYGHRLALYRATQPHDGFRVLRKWAAKMRQGAFVFTSNVDGHFQKAGFDIDRIVEVHGSIHYLQCLVDCGMGLFSADKAKVDVNPADMLAQRPLPACPACGSQARPNILMFDDMEWDSSRTVAQQARLKEWLEAIGGSRLVIVECGAGMTIPTVRWYCETTANARGATLIRINLREAAVPKNQIGIAAGAMETLLAIDRALTSA